MIFFILKENLFFYKQRFCIYFYILEIRLLDRVTFITGQRGSNLLLFNNYTFSKNNQNGKATYWNCRTRQIKKPACKARLITYPLENGHTKVVVTHPEHNHPQPWKKIQSLKKSR